MTTQPEPKRPVDPRHPCLELLQVLAGVWALWVEQQSKRPEALQSVVDLVTGLKVCGSYSARE